MQGHVPPVLSLGLIAIATGRQLESKQRHEEGFQSLLFLVGKRDLEICLVFSFVSLGAFA